VAGEGRFARWAPGTRSDPSPFGAASAAVAAVETMVSAVGPAGEVHLSNAPILAWVVRHQRTSGPR
jgi:hypothetical protein